jgi:hypothetical protein
MKIGSNHVLHEIETEDGDVRYCKALPDVRCNYLGHNNSKCGLFHAKLEMTTPKGSDIPGIYEYHVLRCKECLENFRE